MFSIYTTAFNLEFLKFDYDHSLSNFCKFAGSDGEVVVAIPRLTNDNTYELLLKWRNANKADNLKLFLCNFTPDDPEYDGKLKNFSLQHCNSDNIMIQMDIDEIFILRQKDKWEEYAKFLDCQNNFECFMIPVLEPYGDISEIREDHGVKLKFRMHKVGLKRGVVDFAKLPDGIHHDINLSDGTEIINEQNQLVKNHKIINEDCYESLDNYLEFLKNDIYTLHLGYLNFEKRVLRNNLFWQKMWSTEAGEEILLPSSVGELNFPTVKHGLIFNLTSI